MTYFEYFIIIETPRVFITKYIPLKLKVVLKCGYDDLYIQYIVNRAMIIWNVWTSASSPSLDISYIVKTNAWMITYYQSLSRW